MSAAGQTCWSGHRGTALGPAGHRVPRTTDMRSSGPSKAPHRLPTWKRSGSALALRGVGRGPTPRLGSNGAPSTLKYRGLWLGGPSPGAGGGSSFWPVARPTPGLAPAPKAPCWEDLT